MCLFQILILLVDIVGNIYTLTTHQPFITALSMDYGLFIVLFNAAMILIPALVSKPSSFTTPFLQAVVAAEL